MAFGSNHKDPPERTPFCELLWGALDDFMLKILIGCAFFQLTFEMGIAAAKGKSLMTAWIEGFAILFAVAVVSLVTAGSDYSKEGQFLKQQLIEENTKVVTVRRENQEETIHRNKILVGDVIMIKNGMNIPVDGIMIEGTGVLCDESSMTGESDHLIKEALDKCHQRQREHEEDGNKSRTPHDVPSPVMLSGTQVQTGQGWFVVVVVGEMTCEGQILASVEAKEQEVTPLQMKLDVIAADIGKVGMYTALLIFHVLVAMSFLRAIIFRKFTLFDQDGPDGTLNKANPNSATHPCAAAAKANRVYLKS